MPKYFIILYTGTELWYEYIQWLNKTYDCDWEGTDTDSYYGFDGSYSNWVGNREWFDEKAEVITLEQWAQWNNIQTNYEIY